MATGTSKLENCPVCGKLFRKRGLHNHLRLSHRVVAHATSSNNGDPNKKIIYRIVNNIEFNEHAYQLLLEKAKATGWTKEQLISQLTQVMLFRWDDFENLFK